MNSRQLIDGVHALSGRLTECSVPHAFGGAIAYGFFGNPRVTNDYDINVFLPESSAEDVFACLRPLGVEAGIDSVRTVEKTGQVRLNWNGTMVDLFFAYAPFHDAARTRIREVVFEGRHLSILSPEDLVVFKAIFNRPHDWEDIERVLAEQLDHLDLDYVTKWLAEILGDDDSRIQRLRETAASARELAP